LTRTETTAGETFSTTSAKPGCCCVSTRTASANTGAVPEVTAPRPTAEAIATDAAAAAKRLPAVDLGENGEFIVSCPFRFGCGRASLDEDLGDSTLHRHFRHMKCW